MTEIAVFAGGCFWGVQYYFDQIPGVVATRVGYTGGLTQNPTYELVCTQTTGHTEAVEITYDPSLVDFSTLLKHFFLIHDPTRADGQGLDIGNNYRPVVFYTSINQKKVAEDFIKSLEKASVYKSSIKTELQELDVFWPAEDYHQKYAQRTGRGICHVDYRPIS